MKTTIDLPDEILHRAKIVAAQRKTTLKDLVVAGLTHTLAASADHEETQRRESAERFISALQANNSEPMHPLSRGKSMIVSFFDTNIFLYAASNAPEDAGKKLRAAQLIRRNPARFPHRFCRNSSPMPCARNHSGWMKPTSTRFWNSPGNPPSSPSPASWCKTHVGSACVSEFHSGTPPSSPPPSHSVARPSTPRTSATAKPTREWKSSIRSCEKNILSVV